MQLARPDDEDLKKLLAQFVCVRVVQGNDVDLSLFQFDYDATFAAFFLNADRTIYGRFGARSAARDGAEHVTSAAFQKALRGALRLHAGYPANREELAGKSGEPAVAARPADLAALRRYDDAVDFAAGGAGVDASCIHCHQLGTGQALERWQRKQPLSDEVLFPWPMPDVVGFTTTVAHDLTVAAVAPESAAAKAGLRPGDELLHCGGQPLLSLADLQWVLHRAPATSKISFVAQRGAERVLGSFELAAGWRRPGQRTWRMSGGHASLAALPRLVLGGLRLREVDAARRAELGLAADALALESNAAVGGGRQGRGERGGRGGAEPPALQPGDVIVGLDGSHARMGEIEVMAHLFQQRRIGDVVPVVVLRNGERVTLDWRL